ncbi:MAG: DUF2652 domain-containing protein [Anaerolineales bacterium]
MKQVEKGIIHIADISGYTAFLNESELEHAQGTLQSLLEVLIENTQLPLVISRLEGDAVISYATDASFLQGSSVLEMVESSYIAFRRALELMVINTTCTCNACRNITNLDLKFFIHHGSYALQPLATYTELVGTDVNTAHRLTKNHVVEETGYEAYALFTRAAVEALNIQEIAEEMVPLKESYEHIGEVDIFVMDMHQVWEAGKEQTRIIVSEDEALVVLEFDFPVSVVQLWDYLLKPEMRALFTNSDRAETENAPQGRIGEGSVYYCAHGSLVVKQTIVDWQPFETHTTFDLGTFGLPTYVTYRLSETENGSHLKMLSSPVQAKNPLKRWAGGLFVKLALKSLGHIGPNSLRQRMEEDLANGELLSAEESEIYTEALRESIRTALLEAKE